MSKPPDIVQRALSDFRIEADRLREEINRRETEFEEQVGPLRDQLREMENVISRIDDPRSPELPASDRAPRGSVKRSVLKALQGHSGMTVNELAERTRIARPTLYATLKRLRDTGEVESADADGGVVHRLVD